MTLNSLKPAVTRSWLIAVAGLMWTGVGVMLCGLAYHWLLVINKGTAAGFGSLGIIMAVTAYRLGFLKIVRKNIDRLCILREKTCIFAFQTWKGYLIIAFMITLGTILRNSAIPKQYLAIVYTTIGGAIFLSSFHYYKLLWETLVQKSQHDHQPANSSDTY